jgi:ParB/RepB/Spo0J family partition protein
MPVLKAVSLDEIDFNDKSYIFRHTFNVDDLENSIEYEGLLYSPILVKPENGKHIIVAGYRRLTACKNLGRKKVNCILYDIKDKGKEEFLKISIAENTKRKDLKPVEIAEALLRIKEELKLSDEELAAQFGETFNIGSDCETVQKYLKLNLFDEETKDILADTNDSGVEFELAEVGRKDDRNALLDIVKQNKTIKKNQLKKIIDNAKKLNEESGSKGSLKSVLQENSLSGILSDENLSGSKKINAYLGELENKAYPERAIKIEKQNEIIIAFKEYLRSNEIDFSSKISIKKKLLDDKTVRLTLDIDSTKELKEMLKILYEGRKKYISPLINL